MKIVDLLEYFDGIYAYWFNIHSNALIEIDEGLSHGFDVILNSEKYGFSKDDLLSSPVIDDSIKNLLRHTRITVDNAPNLALDFDGNPAIVQFMGKKGWCRIVVDDNEININTNSLKNAQKASIFLIDKYPNINAHVIEIETFRNNKSKRDYTTLRGNRLTFFIKYGAIPSQSIMEEIELKTYLHGSSTPLEPGTIMTGRGQDYENDWQNTDFYHILEKYRPAGKLSHKDAVFMVGSDEDIDLAGGPTDYILTLQPLGPVSKHDLNWGSEISMLVSDGYSPESEEIRRAAENYWNGVPHTDESVWEYLTPKAKVLKVEEY